MLIAIRVDGSAQMGGGHVMRCLTLANALAERGSEVVFVCAQLVDGMADHLRGAGHRLVLIDPLTNEAAGPGWDSAIHAVDAQREDARRTLEAIGVEKADWLVVDHYRLDRHWEQPARAGAASLMVIDDLAERPHDCDLLLDQTFGRSPQDYEGLVPSTCRVLAGAIYALLRPEFAAWREGALARRETARPAQRLLISLGTTDLSGITERVLSLLINAGIDCPIDVVLGPSAPSFPSVQTAARSYSNIQLHVDVRDMAPLIAAADLAIGAAGTTSWERCCLGLPSVVLVLADNQRLVAEKLAEVGAVVVAPGEHALPQIVRDLSNNAEARLLMTAAAAAIADGGGAARIAELMLGRTAAVAGPLRARDATENDSRLAWLWRNDPQTRAASVAKEPIAWPRHAAWWSRALGASDRHLMVAEADGEAVAVLRFDVLAAEAGAFEVSINIRPEARGGGIGRRVLTAGVEEMERRHGAVRLEAVIHQNNIASQRVFAALGFRGTGSLGGDGFGRYVRPKSE